MAREALTDTFTCPRRDELGPTSPFNVPAEDTWRPDGTCSWCGSQKPEAVFTAIDAGEELVPTDKNYKLYLKGYKKFYFPHLSDDDKQRFIAALNEKRVKLGYPGYFYTMPYFITVGDK